MDIYNQLIMILAPPGGVLLAWFVVDAFRTIRADNRSLKASVAVLKKADVVAEMLMSNYKTDLSKVEEKLEEVLKILDRHGSAMVMLKSDLVHIQKALIEVRALRENYGKIIHIIDQMAKKQ